MLEWDYKKDPGSDGTFSLEWGDFLDGATIASSSWIIPTGISSASDSHDDYDAFIKIAGGTDDESYELENTIVDSNGDTWNRSVILRVKER